MSLLKNIHGPADLKRLSPTQFPDLCQELREQIVQRHREFYHSKI